MAGPGDLHVLAQEFLDACASALDTIPSYEPHLLGAQDRQFISPGIPAQDCCEQLAVFVTPVSEADTTPGGLAAGKRVKIGRINHVRLFAHTSRCIPTDVEPPVGQLNAASEQLNADAWALWNHIFNLIESGQLLTLCQEVFFDGITAMTPSGGCGGWIVNVRVELDGYQEDLGS